MIGGGAQKITVEIGGKIAASLSASLRGAQTQVSTFGRNVSRTMNDAAIAGRRSFKGMFDSALWQQATIGATAFAGAIGLSVRAAMEFDKAMADVRKAIDFKEGEKGLKQFSNELIRLSGELPYTAAQLSQIAASAGFAGYAEDEIIPFTRAAARMGIAFQMTAEQAGDAMVALRASMGLTQPQVEKLGDAINYLSDRFQGTVNAADLTEVTRRIGAIGKAAGLTAEQVAGLGAAFLASGTPTEVAATGLKNFLNALTKGQQATANQQFALATLFRGEDIAAQIKTGKGAAKKAAKGMAADISEELAKGMQIDPEETIKSVLEKMAKLPKEQQVSIAGALFGEESKAAIMPLLTNTKLIGQAFDLIRQESAFAGSMQKEFQNQMATSGAQTKIFQNGINALGISIGSALLPSLNGILKVLTPLLVRFAEFAQNNQGLVTGIVLIGGALAGLIIVLPIIAGVISAIGTIGTALASVSLGATIAGWLGIVGPAMAAIGAAFTGFASTAVAGLGAVGAAGFTAMLPLLPWIALIAGIGAAIYGLVRYWPQISAAAGQAWSVIVSGFQQMVSAIMSSGLGQVISGMGQQLSGLVNLVQGAWNLIVGIFTLDAGRAVAGVAQVFGGLDQIGAGILAVATGLGRLLVNGFMAGVQLLGSVVQWIGSVVVAGLQALGSAAVSLARGTINAIVAVWRTLPGLIIAGIQGVIAGVQRIFNQVVDFIRQIPGRVADVGSRIIEAILNGLKARAGALFGWVSDAWSRISSMVSGGPDAPGDPADAPAATPAARPAGGRSAAAAPARRAMGGRVRAGLPYIVGELRRELFVPGVDGAIIPRIARPLTAAAVSLALQAPAPAMALPGPEVSLTVPPMAPPAVSIALPAPVVNVAAPGIQVDAGVPAIASPSVSIAPPAVNVAAPIVTTQRAPNPQAPARRAPVALPATAAAAQRPVAPVTINAPITINASSGDAMEIRRQVEIAFYDIQHEIESSHRVLLND